MVQETLLGVAVVFTGENIHHLLQSASGSGTLSSMFERLSRVDQLRDGVAVEVR